MVKKGSRGHQQVSCALMIKWFQKAPEGNRCEYERNAGVIFKPSGRRQGTWIGDSTSLVCISCRYPAGEVFSLKSL